MTIRTRLGILLSVLAVALAGAVPASAGSGGKRALPVMVGLGDSWTYGQGATDPATGGYLAVARGVLRSDLDCLPAVVEEAADGCKHLRIRNYARPALPGLPGVTTDAVIDEQLPDVLPFVAKRNGDANPRNDVEAIFLSAGGNDVSSPIIEACIFGTPEQCDATLNERFGHIATNMTVILGSLREAAGPDTPIVLVTYDNPIAFCDLGGIPGAAILGYELLYQVDQIYRGVAAGFDVDVATTLGELGAGDWVGGADCLHPTDSGHAKVGAIAAAQVG